MIGPTLSRYLAWRFLKSILTIFVATFCLMFVVYFIELFRRAGDNPEAGAGEVVKLALMQVPFSMERVLPFAVLFGAMATFVDLTRKLELIVARAAGVSVWQFLTPPVLVAFLAGVVSVALYNPLSATLKQRADHMEFTLFGVPGSVRLDHGVWLRQHGVDGLAIIHAVGATQGGTDLTEVSASLYAPEGGFLERVEAARATLQPGAWLFQDARVSAPGEATVSVGNYLLATDLTPEELAIAIAPPQAVPFWDLPERERTALEAGLDARGYQLQFHKLLARPLFLVAMSLIAAAFSLRFFRSGGVVKTLAGGVAGGFMLYIIAEIFSDLGGAGDLNPMVAAWSPAMVGSLLGTLSLLYSEDG